MTHANEQTDSSQAQSLGALHSWLFCTENSDPAVATGRMQIKEPHDDGRTVHRACLPLEPKSLLEGLGRMGWTEPENLKGGPLFEVVLRVVMGEGTNRTGRSNLANPFRLNKEEAGSRSHTPSG